MTRTLKWLRVLGITMLGVFASAAAPAPKIPAACRGLPNAEQQISILTDPRNILAIQKIETQQSMSDTDMPDSRGGARIVVMAWPSVTVEWLQRIAECHLAQNAARGYPSSATQSPLDVKGAMVNVSSVGDGFAVDVTSDDSKLAREILRRAQRLLAAAPTS